MTNQELYKQAILDAKAVRETAMAAARESLAEAFEPSIKEMLRLKLSEELQEDGDLEEAYSDEAPFNKGKKTPTGSPFGKGTTDEPRSQGGYVGAKVTNKSTGGSLAEDQDGMDESTLDEILAELDGLSEDESDGINDIDTGTMEEMSSKEKMAKGLYKEAGEDQDEADAEMDADAAAEGDNDVDAEGAGEVSDDEQVVELTVGELKELFRDVFAQSQGGQPMEAPGPEAGEETLEIPGMNETEISLEEILAELEEEEDKMAMEEDVNIPPVEMTRKKTPGKYQHGAYQVDESKELEEANKAIKTMRAELQEVNLLNAKLLYVNKLWKGKSLNESQKVKILNAFDRATTVREAENIYKTLNESTIAAPKKSALKESMSFASKAIGTAPARPIVEVDSMVARWKTLAGIQ